MYSYVSKALKAPPSIFDVEDVLDLGFRVQGLGASGLPFADARPLELQCFGFGNYLTGRFSKHSPIVSRARAQRGKAQKRTPRPPSKILVLQDGKIGSEKLQKLFLRAFL